MTSDFTELLIQEQIFRLAAFSHELAKSLNDLHFQLTY